MLNTITTDTKLPLEGRAWTLMFMNSKEIIAGKCIHKSIQVLENIENSGLAYAADFLNLALWNYYNHVFDTL